MYQHKMGNRKMNNKLVFTLVWPEQFFPKSMSVLLVDNGAWSVLAVLFPKLSMETRGCKDRKGNFLEEQNALEMILGCFRVSCFLWAGEATLEFCSDGGLLTQCSKMFL